MRQKCEARADRVWDVLVNHDVYKGDIIDVQSTIVDLVADTMHLCEKKGIKFEDVVRIAKGHYDAEVKGHDDPDG